jgi:hypothetical protein
MTINANTSVLEYERLTAERTQARLARKTINRARYLRRYARIGGHKPERMDLRNAERPHSGRVTYRNKEIGNEVDSSTGIACGVSGRQCRSHS